MELVKRYLFRNYHFSTEVKIFSVAKILQRVVKYFCSEMCPRVQRIFGIFLRIFRATEMRVALEVKEFS